MSGVVAAKVSMVGPLPAVPAVRVHIHYEGRPVEVREFSGVAQITVGRDAGCSLPLGDLTVSRRHALLSFEPDGLHVEDISTNGTFLDGERVSGEAPIAPGALLRFGGIGVMFESTDDTVDPAKGSSTKMLQAIKMPPPSPGSSGQSPR